MLSSIGLILLSLAFIVSIKKSRARITRLEAQLLIAVNTSAWVIRSSKNRKQLIGMLGEYVLTTQSRIEDPKLGEALMEGTPDLPWKDAVDNAKIVAFVLSRFKDEENPLTNGGNYYPYSEDQNQSD